LNVPYKQLCDTCIYVPQEPQTMCNELDQELTRHARLLHMLKARMASGAPAGLDGAAFGVLMALVRCGPRRQGEIADFTLLDPSTVSRYVGQLVKAGFVSRRPDPGDGRAVHLVATPEGTALAGDAAARRQSMIASMLADWSAEDAGALVTLMRRLNDEMEVRRDGFEPAHRT
jgi:DNA-binding MarR family transcriptional regulator